MTTFAITLDLHNGLLLINNNYYSFSSSFLIDSIEFDAYRHIIQMALCSKDLMAAITPLRVHLQLGSDFTTDSYLAHHSVSLAGNMSGCTSAKVSAECFTAINTVMHRFYEDDWSLVTSIRLKKFPRKILRTVNSIPVPSLDQCDCDIHSPKTAKEHLLEIMTASISELQLQATEACCEFTEDHSQPQKAVVSIEMPALQLACIDTPELCEINSLTITGCVQFENESVKEISEIETESESSFVYSDNDDQLSRQNSDHLLLGDEARDRGQPSIRKNNRMSSVAKSFGGRFASWQCVTPSPQDDGNPKARTAIVKLMVLLLIHLINQYRVIDKGKVILSRSD